MALNKKNPIIDPNYLAKAKEITIADAEQTHEINLEGFYLKGKVTIKNFPHLEALNLVSNEITDLEVDQVSSANLSKLDLGCNKLTNLNFLKNIDPKIIRILLLNDNCLNEVTLDKFYSMLNLVELNLSNHSNSVGEKAKKNSVITYLHDDLEIAFTERLGSGLNLANAEVDSLELDPLNLEQTDAGFELVILNWLGSHKWFWGVPLAGLLIFLIYLIISKFVIKPRKR